MHVDAGLQSPSGKKEFGCGDGASKGLKKVEEFQEPMQIEERPIPVIGAATKSTEKVVSLVNRNCLGQFRGIRPRMYIEDLL